MPLLTDDIEQTIQNRIVSLMTAVPAANIFFENIAEEPAAQAAGAPWIEVFISHGTNSQISLAAPGSRDFRARGTINAIVNAPMGQGKSTLSQIIDALRAVFEGATFDGAACHIRIASTTLPPAAPRNGYMAGTVIFNFWADSLQ